MEISTAMQFTLLSKSIRTIGLITILSAITSVNLVKPAQAQANPSTGSVCTAAYFDDPGYMYQTATEEQEAAVQKYLKNPDRLKRLNRMMAEVTTFSAPLDSPMGYVVNKVNGKTVAIPLKIKKAINQAVNVAPSQNNRKRVAELNRKYGQYATFGQNITLILSPEQVKEADKDTYEFLAYIKSVLTPQEQQAQRDIATAAPIADGYCSPSALFKPGQASRSIDTGTRPDLDKRLREDKTGTTLFQ
ncbi:hypothetical protein [Phormidesmis sp. 146-20]